MGRRYLARSDRYPSRFRHLKYSWPAVGSTKVDAPNISPPVRDQNGTPVNVQFYVTAPTPRAAVSYTIEADVADDATGAITTVTTTYAAAANMAPGALATAIAAALAAKAELLAQASGNGVGVAAKVADTTIVGVRVYGAPTAAVPTPTGEAADEPAPVAAPVAVTVTAGKRSGPKKGN